MRINARIEQDQARKLELVKRTEKLTTTQVVKQALDVYFASKQIQRKTDVQQLLSSPLIGNAQGDPGLSQSYKQQMTEGLAQKHDTD